jgi:hypothetical protein
VPSQDTSIINLIGNVTDATQVQQADGSTPPFSTGRQGDQLGSEIHGKFYTSNYRTRSFEANASAITVPVNAANLVSVFTLYNPTASGVNAEIIDTSVFQVLAATVVDTVGWYYSTAVLTQKGTFTTPGTVNGGRVGGATPNQVLFYSAYTHSGTPVLADFIGSFGAVTNVTAGGIQKFYDGRLILPPGIAMSVAMTTAAGTASGLAVEVRWSEWFI